MQQPWRSDKHSHITTFQVLTATKTIIYGIFPFPCFYSSPLFQLYSACSQSNFRLVESGIIGSIMDWHRWSLAYFEKDSKQLRFNADDTPITILESYYFDVCLLMVWRRLGMLKIIEAAHNNGFGAQENQLSRWKVQRMAAEGTVIPYSKE